MGTFVFFHDLSRINFQDAEFRELPAPEEDSDFCWAPFKSQDMAFALSTHELDRSPSHGSPQLSSKPRYPSIPGTPDMFHGLSTWTANPSSSHDMMRPLASQCEGLNPLPYNLAIPRDASPDGWWNGNRPALEQDSCSGGSTWSPRTSEGHLETDPSCRVAWKEYQDPSTTTNYVSGFSHIFPGYGADGSSEFASGIAPCQIQHYPDVGLEDVPHKSRIPDVNLGNPYYLESTGLPPSPADSLPEDESMNSSTPECDDMPMVDDIEDNLSDYTPPAKRAHRRATSRTSIPFAPTKRLSHPPKAPSTTLSKPAKITKRASASKPLAPIPSPTSSTPRAAKSSKSPCPQCSSSFQSISALHKHTLASHTRPFACSFGRYGCLSTFGSKNEWKRHVSSQHLRLGIFRCDIGTCIPVPNQHRRKFSSSSMGYGKVARGSFARHSDLDGGVMPAEAATGTGFNDFNRKDLFTQHVRRMHAPPPSASRADKDAFDASLEAVRARCWIALRAPPPRSTCGFCHPSTQADTDKAQDASCEEKVSKEVVFDGTGAWDERMEHVGKHLERGEVLGTEREDVGLREWMVKEGLMALEKGTWKVVGCGGRRKGRGASGGVAGGEVRDAEGDEDGEGEEE